MTPTLDLYTALQGAFDHFNAALFEGKLPQCLITLRSSNRHYGYMQADRFVNIAGKKVDELGINPSYFAVKSLDEVMSTLVHEMVHHWQNHFGVPSKSNPHNAEWAAKMEALGLMPTNTGLPEGDRTGRSVTHYILPNGPFIKACGALTQKGFQLPWLDRHLAAPPERMVAQREELMKTGLAHISEETAPVEKAIETGVELTVYTPIRKPSPKRIRQSCPKCGICAWTDPEVAIVCGGCHLVMVGSGAA